MNSKMLMKTCLLFLTLLVKRKMLWIDSEINITETKLFVHVTIHKFGTRNICLNIQITGRF